MYWIFETEFSDEFSLSRLSTEQYVRDKRFKAHGAAIKWSKDHDAKWYDEPHLREVLKNEDWSDVFLIHHHANFDGLILSHHYGVTPAMFGDTLSMARLLIGNHLSVSLDSVRQHYGMPVKKTPYHLFKGKEWSCISDEHRALIADGACDEVESIWKLFGILAKDFPQEEYLVVSETVKMFTNPALRADVDMLATLWEKEEREKSTRLLDLGIDGAELRSSDRFADILRAEGVEPETKKGKNGPIYCFAKSDSFMEALLDDENPRVRALAEARLGEKSTLLQTRAETFGFMATRRSGRTDGALPVYLRYAGAGTLRPSGGDKTGFLNLKRRSPLRRALLAPEGFLLGPVDASQIECRCLHYLAGGPDEPVIQKFRNKEDPYIDLASQFYKEPIYKPEEGDPRAAEMEAKRGMGKQGRLMCGYGAAGPKFKATARAGLYGPPVDISLKDANDFVQLYRQTTPSVCAPNSGYWAQAGRMLSRLAGGAPTQWGPLEVRNGRIYLPNGCPLIYDTLEFHKPEPGEEIREFEANGYWRVRTRNGWKTMWGSKLVQNICEAVSRVIVSQALIRCAEMGYRALNWPYDELLFLIPKDGKEEWHLERCRQEMIREVSWLPGLPLDAEVKLGERYAK